MKTILITLVMILSFQTFGQDRMFIISERAITNEAKTLAAAYNNELALNNDQFQIFEIKIQKFLNRRQQLNESLTGRTLLETLYQIRMQEILEMQRILNYDQLKTYEKLKRELQPIRINNSVLSAI
jgi:hypothetical protein